MAGSYAHCWDDKHQVFRFDLIENLGDAHEACEQMVWMIRHLAQGDDAKIKAAEDAYYKDPNTMPWLRGRGR